MSVWLEQARRFPGLFDAETPEHHPAARPVEPSANLVQHMSNAEVDLYLVDTTDTQPEEWSSFMELCADNVLQRLSGLSASTRVGLYRCSFSVLNRRLWALAGHRLKPPQTLHSLANRAMAQARQKQRPRNKQLRRNMSGHNRRYQSASMSTALRTTPSTSITRRGPASIA